MLLEGLFVPMTTPFYPDGRVYGKKVEHNAERYSRTPAAGMVVLGANGEGAGLTDAESCAVLGAAIGAAAKEKVMIAGVGRESVAATLDLCEAAAAAGYDAVAVRGPEFCGDSAMRGETMVYFQAVADRSPLPVVVVSDGVREVSEEALVELAGHWGVIGVIDDRAAERVERLKAAGVSREVTVTTVFAAVTGRMLKAGEAGGSGSFVSAETLGAGGGLAVAPPVAGLKTRTKKVGFQVLGGRTDSMLAAWKGGASGALPRLGASAPQACCEMWQAWRDGDLGLAEEKERRVMAAAGRMEGFGGVAWSKYGCDFNGYYGGRPRLPLVGLNGAMQRVLEGEMGSLRN